jgi:Family of unknown function (DUF6326)
MVVTDKSAAPGLDEIKVHVKFKLSALWSSVMFCYIYGDYFQLYQPGQLQAIIAGKMAFFVITQWVLLGMAAVMAIPSVMVFLALVLPPRVNRWANIILGAVYTVIMILVIQGGWHFYVFFGLIEITLTGLIVWYAWTWFKQPTR